METSRIQAGQGGAMFVTMNCQTLLMAVLSVGPMLAAIAIAKPKASRYSTNAWPFDFLSQKSRFWLSGCLDFKKYLLKKGR